MASTTSNVNMFQKVLDEDTEIRSSYLQAENDSDEDDEEEDDACKIIIPSRPKNKHTDTSQELLFQLMRQNQVLSKTQKKMYQLKAELDKEEITSRYIKLDLNNAYVKLDETKDKFKICNKKLKNARIENWIVRGLILLYFLFQFYSFLYNQLSIFSNNYV
jgi:hypothetical protein